MCLVARSWGPHTSSDRGTGDGAGSPRSVEGCSWTSGLEPHGPCRWETRVCAQTMWNLGQAQACRGATFPGCLLPFVLLPPASSFHTARSSSWTRQSGCIALWATTWVAGQPRDWPQGPLTGGPRPVSTQLLPLWPLLQASPLYWLPIWQWCPRLHHWKLPSVSM